MRIVGLIGGVAAGKTTISSILHDLGAPVISADPIVHQILVMPEIQEQMWFRWNKSFGFENHWTRRDIADIVFTHPEELKFLEDITAIPLVAELDRKIGLYHPTYTKVLVLDIPLLVEMGYNQRCDQVWYVDAPREFRLENFCKRYKAAFPVALDLVDKDMEKLEKDFATREERLGTYEYKQHLVTDRVFNYPNDLERTKRDVVSRWESLVRDRRLNMRAGITN